MCFSWISSECGVINDPKSNNRMVYCLVVIGSHGLFTHFLRGETNRSHAIETYPTVFVASIATCVPTVLMVQAMKCAALSNETRRRSSIKYGIHYRLLMLEIYTLNLYSIFYLFFVK